jgi:hypothetical protein
MPFNIHQLDHLDYDDVEPILDEYIQAAIEQFVNSPEGQTYVETHPRGGNWIGEFIYLASAYEGFTLSTMTKNEVQLLMEQIFPRKFTIFDESEAEDAIPELIAFWQFLQREYNLRRAAAIVKYLETLRSKFPRLMCDPTKGGMAKAFLLMGQQAGVDMRTEEGIQDFQQNYNASLESNSSDPNTKLLQKIIQAQIPGSSSAQQSPIPKPQGQKPEGTEKPHKQTKQAKRKKK